MLDHREFLKRITSYLSASLAGVLLRKRWILLVQRQDVAAHRSVTRRISPRSSMQQSAEMKKVAASGDKDALAKGREALQALKAKIKDAEQVQRDAEEALGELF